MIGKEYCSIALQGVFKTSICHLKSWNIILVSCHFSLLSNLWPTVRWNKGFGFFKNQITYRRSLIWCHISRWWMWHTKTFFINFSSWTPKKYIYEAKIHTGSAARSKWLKSARNVAKSAKKSAKYSEAVKIAPNWRQTMFYCIFMPQYLAKLKN